MLMLASALLSFFFVGVFIKLAGRFGWGKAVRKDGPKSHLFKEGTPTMGGVAFWLAGFSIWLIAVPKTADGWALLALTVAAAALGWADDMTSLQRKRRISEGAVDELDASTGVLARYRLLVQGMVALAFALYALMQGHALLSFDSLWLHNGFNILAFIFVVMGTVNAVNLTDGIDGLATGVSFIILLPFISNPLVFCVMGALLGFLWHNSKPAKVFMGGVGSEALGALIAGVFILSDKTWWLPLMAAVPVVEVVSVMMQVSYFKITKGKRIFRMTPIHHHFEEIGWKEEKIAARFWIVTALCVALGWSLWGGV